MDDIFVLMSHHHTMPNPHRIHSPTLLLLLLFCLSLSSFFLHVTTNTTPHALPLSFLHNNNHTFTDASHRLCPSSSAHKKKKPIMSEEADETGERKAMIFHGIGFNLFFLAAATRESHLMESWMDHHHQQLLRKSRT